MFPAFSSKNERKISYEPESLKDEVESVNANKQDLPLLPGGIRYDVIGLVDDKPKILDMFDRTGDLTIKQTQTITIKTPEGFPILQMINKITVSRSEGQGGINFTPGTAKKLTKEEAQDILLNKKD